MKQLPKVLIPLLIATLIAAPPVISGYANLGNAQNTPNRLEASRYYESAAQLLFWRPELYEQAGLQAFPEDAQRAIQMLTTARQKGALSPDGQVILGDAYRAKGETDQALREWETLLSDRKAMGEVAPRLAREYRVRGQDEAEVQALRQWLGVDPGNMEANERLGLHLAATAAPEALAHLELAANASTETASRLAGLIAALKTPIEDPAYRLTLSGQALAGLNEWKLAEQAFSNAVEANPEYATAWAWLGLARQKNDKENALEALEDALRLDGKSAPLHAMLGTYWLEAGEFQKARAEFETATQLEPSNPAWWQGLAGAAAHTDLTVALNAYLRAIDLAPLEAESWYALAAFCVENGAYLEDYGLEAALRAFALDAQNPAYMDMLGRAQMDTGQTEAAEVMFKKALAAGPQTAFIPRFHLGLLYLQTGRSAEAKEEFRQTVALDPQGPYGQQAKALLERYFP